MGVKAIDFPPLQIDYAGERLAGVDEVGRGPLVGSVVAAAVILDPARPIDGLTDSKKLTARRREALDNLIREHALAFTVAEASAAEVDQLNIYHATHLAMRRAIDGLAPAAEYLLVDGNRLPGHVLPGQAVVKGDARHPAIAAASILAKVARDAQMVALDMRYPEYGFARHKGYPTREHLSALAVHGPLADHRRSFAPVQRQLALL
ncbi:ribonuclease HII [Halomonas janggokensis]|jgi:ribonuclease HII|uniref:Ribonuclease HII n=1 Tax=Vreelandella janggokensis TaxID=370767 RepID=A0ABT4IRD5_9GAMM|nr:MULTISPECIES: ribonuclease HII [Halomonas]MCW4150145.1 ribonuclease HII [Halomonas sp. 18H]MCZ0926230.1 ribonuclease HII [Halomonas janggokensis]MCZ0931297.1 ribonuclease HII [Halomonas janggokensis]QPL46718.1 ribonuclease HII [Halomonas sp. A40-4]